MPSCAAGPSIAQAHAWAFRYAPHLGYRSPALPLFRHCAQSVYPTDQAEHIRSLGFHGVQYPWAVGRPASERGALAERLHNLGLACGCIAWAPMDVLRTPLWINNDQQTRQALKDHLEQAVQVALQMGSEIIAVLGAAEGPAPLTEPHRRAMSENLRWAGDFVAVRGLTIGLEPMIALPNMALKSCEDGLEMIHRVDHPAIRLIFDTGHVHDLDPNVVGVLEKAFDDVCLVQFADQPGRIEPGAGTIDFGDIFRVLRSRKYAGLIELEHGWKLESSQGEIEGLQHLRQLDEAAKA